MLSINGLRTNALVSNELVPDASVPDVSVPHEWISNKLVELFEDKIEGYVSFEAVKGAAVVNFYKGGNASDVVGFKQFRMNINGDAKLLKLLGCLDKTISVKPPHDQNCALVLGFLEQRF